MTSTPLSRFRRIYRTRADPWRTAQSWYEQRKRLAALTCLPRSTYSEVIEPACGTGELSACLAARCAHLDASDGLATVVRRARRRLRRYRHVTVSRRVLPHQFPHDPATADLVVLSEILYYLDESDFDALTTATIRALRSGGDLLAVHWRPHAHDAPSDGDSVHRRLRARPELEPLAIHAEQQFLVDVLRRR